jgi:two-component system chemotaxis response regulator CheY
MSHVLIIDDSSTTRLYYRDNLEQAGFAVDEAINGIEGLEKAMSQSFDLILVDVNMPKMDGYTFMSQLRRTAELRSVPTIMISTQAEQADRTRAYAVGANAYVVKPVDPAVLVAYGQLLSGLETTGGAVA